MPPKKNVVVDDAEKQKYDAALGELLRAADRDVLAKSVIATYRHEATHAQNLAALSGSKFSKETLERCADFFELQTLNAEGGKLFKNKPSLADKIILKIESFFENTCDE